MKYNDQSLLPKVSDVYNISFIECNSLGSSQKGSLFKFVPVSCSSSAHINFDMKLLNQFLWFNGIYGDLNGRY